MRYSIENTSPVERTIELDRIRVFGIVDIQQISNTSFYIGSRIRQKLLKVTTNTIELENWIQFNGSLHVVTYSK